MNRLPGVLSLIVVTAGWLAAARAQDEVPLMTDLIPQKAAGALFFRSPNIVRDRMNVLGEELGWPAAGNILFQFAANELRLNGLVNDDWPAGIVAFDRNLVPEEKQQGFAQPLALAVAVTDLDRLATLLKTTREQLEAGEAVSMGQRAFIGNPRARLLGRYLWIASHDEVFNEISNRTPLTFVIPKERRQAMQEADIIWTISTTSPEIRDPDAFPKLRKEIEGNDDLDAEDKQALRDLLAVAEASTNLVGGIRLQGGFELDLDVVFDIRRRKEVRDVLSRFNPTGAASTLGGLPQGDLLFAHAIQADGRTTLPTLATLMWRKPFGIMWNWFALNDSIVPTNQQSLELLEVFGDVWRQVSGVRAAVYRNADPAQHGMVTTVAILDTPDSRKLIRELREFGEIVDASRVDQADLPPAEAQNLRDRVDTLLKQLVSEDYGTRQGASARLMLLGELVLEQLEPLTADIRPEVARRARRIRDSIIAGREQRRKEALEPGLFAEARPRFVFHEAAEQIRGQAMHVIEIRAEESSELHHRLPLLLGPNGNRLRLVPLDGHVAVLLGSDVSRLNELLENLAENRPGLAAEQRNQPFGQPLLAGRGVEFHAALARIQGLIRSATESQAADDGQSDDDGKAAEVTSGSLTIGADYFSFQFRVPLADLKVARRLLF